MQISIHAPRAGSDRDTSRGTSSVTISIHAPRAGSDLLHGDRAAQKGYFNPRSPCGERRCCPGAVRGVDYFNPRSPCGERPLYRGHMNPESFISIHAPRAGSDGMVRHIQKAEYISIHAPRAGSDHVTIRQGYWYTNFNPRSPCGERRYAACDRRGCLVYFNPRSPCGERPYDQSNGSSCANFNPRSPCGERRGGFDDDLLHHAISIHAPRAGSDVIENKDFCALIKFQSTLPVRGATLGSQTLLTMPR